MNTRRKNAGAAPGEKINPREELHGREKGHHHDKMHLGGAHRRRRRRIPGDNPGGGSTILCGIAAGISLGIFITLWGAVRMIGGEMEQMPIPTGTQNGDPKERI